MAGETRVRGLQDLNRALKRTSKDVRLGIRKEMRGVAEPVRLEAESLAVARIRNIGLAWSRMRIGVTQSSVYVAPKQRGTKDASRKRRNLAGRLMDDAMQPALDHHAAETEREVDEMLGRVANNFSR